MAHPAITRSTKAGARTPATPPAGNVGYRSTAVLASLNEGRGANPGDTWRMRHDRMRPVRSTKAGARTPATRGATRSPVETLHVAQRRPGREPRRHVRIGKARSSSSRARALNEGRGANPGDTLGRRRHGSRTSHVSLRSTKAGARTPATLVRCVRAVRRSSPSLNEGRGANPGDTSATAVPGAAPRVPPRSTKAGARTPATHDSVREQ